MKKHFERIFWLLMLALQLLGIAFELWLEPLRLSLLIVFSIVCCVSMFGLVFQRRIGSKNFWAAAVGILFPFSVITWLSLVAFILLGTFVSALEPEKLIIFAAFALVHQLFAFAAPFFYLYGSPQIWEAVDEN